MSETKLGKEVPSEMAKVDVTYTCGCGFKTNDQAEAVKHSDGKHHSLTVLGTIRKERE